MIEFKVEDALGDIQLIEVPEGIDLSLMEVLKGSDYPILATCGGMALCATCRVDVLKGLENLPDAQDNELDMLDTLPDAKSETRLSCQIKIGENLNGMFFKLNAE